MENGVCENCRFWVVVGGNPGEYIAGECRRYPPSATQFSGATPPDGNGRGIWPMTEAIDWCGEHHGKDTQP